jgi:hypothetical protein
MPAPAQSAAPTPQEAQRALEALRAGLDSEPDMPSALDPHSAATWDMPAAADTAPGLNAKLFEPSTEISSVTPEGDWLPGASMPHEQRAATAAEHPAEDTAEPPSNLATPPQQPKSGKSQTAGEAHSTLRSGRASLDPKPAPRKKPRPKPAPDAPAAPALHLPGELRP